MSEFILATVLVTVPLFAMGIYVLVDIIRRPSATWVKVSWIVAIVLVWPMMLAYLLSRPPSGRIEEKQVERVDRSIGPRARLVNNVQEHEAGRMDDTRFEDALTGLRGGTPRPRPDS